MENKQQPPYPLRMAPELREQLEHAARSGSRSLNAEITSRLEASMEGAHGLQLPTETLKRLKAAAKKSGRTLDGELYSRMLDSLADWPPAEKRLREQLDASHKESGELRVEVEDLRTEAWKRSTMLYVLLDTNGYPISWDEIREHLAGIKTAGGFNPREMQVNVITPDMESSSRRAKEAATMAELWRMGQRSTMSAPPPRPRSVPEADSPDEKPRKPAAKKA